MAAHWQNPTGRWQGSGKGATGERAHAVSIQIRVVGRREAHHGGLATVRESAVRWKTAAAQTVGHRRWRSGRRGTMSPCSARGFAGLAGG
jgi:hypothetical protein